MSRSVLANAADDLPLAHVCVHNTVSSATNKFTSEKCYFYNVIICTVEHHRAKVKHEYCVWSMCMTCQDSVGLHYRK